MIVLTGRVVPGVLAELDKLSNVRASTIDRASADVPDPARSFISRAHATYVVHDDDPLADLGRAWSGFFDESAPVGTLEVAVETTLRAFESGEAVLPDYFIVLDPDSLTDTQKNWWFGALAGVSPSRVVPSGPTAGAVQTAIAGLTAGRWWPEPLGDWIRSISRIVPDQRVLVRPAGDPSHQPSMSRTSASRATGSNRPT